METATLWEDTEELTVADVVVDADAPDLQPTYTYRIPAGMEARVGPGVCVHVPFGGQEKLGYVLAVKTMPASDPLARRLRDIIGPVEGAVTFGSEQAALARYIYDYYVCHLSDAVRCIAPAAMGSRVVTTVSLAAPSITGKDLSRAIVQAHIIETLRRLGGATELEILRKEARVPAFNASYAALLRRGLLHEQRAVSRPRVVARTVRAYRLGKDNADELASSPAGKRILEALKVLTEEQGAPVLPEKLLTRAQAGSAALKTLVEKGAVVIEAVPVRRSATTVDRSRTSAPTLSEGQRNATNWLAQAVHRDEGNRDSRPPEALLFGVTASGKTEVYLDAIARTLEEGRSAVVLLPEIALTTQVVDLFTGRFGDEVAVLHSRLSEGERHDEWRRLQDRHARIAVGARSAVFAPLENLGLIVVDEEHESSYKQESQPRYHARDVARERARIGGATLLLGSATPSVETFHAARRGEITLLEMPERIDNRPLPQVEVVDLREEFKEHKALFSNRLIEEMGDRLSKKQQTILFLNRRGFAQFVLCRDCGYVARCPNCAVSLAFHAAWGALKCHHCGYGRRAPMVCPTCGGARIRGFGVGTEKVEDEVRKLFPSARIGRLDRDTTSRKGEHQTILGQFRRGETDILIGTQMVAKGLDFPNVTLVGVVSADTSINMPDFRAAERTFQLLTQVAGRAGRGVHPGSVIIQTFSPEHYAVEFATRQDYVGFYGKEIGFREELSYPPFCRFVNVISADEERTRAQERIVQFAAACKGILPSDVTLIGPAPAPLSRLKNLYRWHLVLRCPVGAPVSEFVRAALGKLSSAERMGLIVDVDPAGMA